MYVLYFDLIYELIGKSLHISWWIRLAQAMLDTLRLSLRFAGTKVQAGLLLEYRCAEARIYAFCPHSMRVERHEFEAEILMMVPVYPSDGVSDDQVDALPMTLRYMQAVHHTERPWLCINTGINAETQFIVELAEHRNHIWEM